MIGLALVWCAIAAGFALFLAIPTTPADAPRDRRGLYRNGQRPHAWSRRWCVWASRTWGVDLGSLQAKRRRQSFLERFDAWLGVKR